MRRPTSLAEARRRIILALDVSEPDEAFALARRVGDAVGVLKVGLELWARGGRDVARRLVEDGHGVFLDLKFCDIPRTVARATRAVADVGAQFLTLHGPPSSVRAAREELGTEGPALLGVTVLTSVSEDEQRAFSGLGAGLALSDVVARRAELLLEAGCDGLVASARDVAALRRAHPETTLVTPGIRPPGAAVGDQVRVATPSEAAAAGADYLVVGRPIRDAPDPRAAAASIAEAALHGFT